MVKTGKVDVFHVAILGIMKRDPLFPQIHFLDTR